MSPEEEVKPSVGASDPTQAPDQQKRGRRSGRHRGRGRGRRPQPPLPQGVNTQETYAPSAPVDEPTQFSAEPEGTPHPEFAEVRESEPPEVREPAPLAENTVEEGPRQAPPATLAEAIEQVNGVVEALRQSLNDMEEVLELLEVLERQTGADEREVESLRRALRQFHRPPERSHQHRGRS